MSVCPNIDDVNVDLLVNAFLFFCIMKLPYFPLRLMVIYGEMV